MEFTLVDQDYVCKLSKDQLFPLIDPKVLDLGGIYSGSYVLECMFNNFKANDVDIFCSYINVLDLTVGYTVVTDFDQESSYDYRVLGLSLFEKIENGVKYQIISVIEPIETLRNNLHSLFDLDKCASRIFKRNNEYVLVIPKTGPSPYSTVMNWVFQNVPLKRSFKNLARAKKYIKRGFDVDLSLYKDYIEKTLECNICLTEITSEIVSTRCNHHFHTTCLSNWTKYNSGDEVVERKSCCPVCTKPLVLADLDKYIENIKSITDYNFKKYKYTICIVCNTEFSRERENCAITSENNLDICACEDCMRNIYGSIIYPSQKYKCPNCNAIHEFSGGCQNLTCCLFGSDKCKINCTHGSNEFVKFCGHKWIFSEKDRIL